MQLNKRHLTPDWLLNRIRVLIAVVVAGLLISGATAIPLEAELKLLSQWAKGNSPIGSQWFQKIHQALAETNAKYPFVAYGTDWLAFAHFVLAIAFIGPWREPVKNIWIIEFAMIACVLVVPFALIMGAVRGIPIGWRLIDCSFGVFGIIPLCLCRRRIKQLAAATRRDTSAGA